MSSRISRFTALTAGLMVSLLSAQPAAAESGIGTGEAKAGASLQFRVVIPPVVRVTANDHPPTIAAAADGAGARQATQRLVFNTNLRRGLCIDLQLADAGVTHWTVQADTTDGATLTPALGGWRLCVSRPGQHAVTLQHAFTMRPADVVAASTAWPVQLQLAAL